MTVQSRETTDLKSQVVHAPWFRALAKYEKPHLPKALGQIFNTHVPYIGLWIVMIALLRFHVSFWYILPLQVLAAGLVVRIFIIQHDCGHGSFFKSHVANRILGYVSGILTFTPYEDWRHIHAIHHTTSGDLERRGDGDIKTLTVREYLDAPRHVQLGYRIFRNPLFLLGPGSFIQFLILHRFPHKGVGKKERFSVMVTNLGILTLIGLSIFTIGLPTYLLLQLPIISIASSVGVWLFYVQHQYEDVYWEHHPDWDPIRAALEGSSYFRLPKVLQWFSGNIGLHHIHHLRPRIPNYHLQQCYDEVPELQVEQPLTLRKSFRCLFLNLWDEKSRELVSFRAARSLYGNRATENARS